MVSARIWFIDKVFPDMTWDEVYNQAKSLRTLIYNSLHYNGRVEPADEQHQLEEGREPVEWKIIDDDLGELRIWELYVEEEETLETDLAMPDKICKHFKCIVDVKYSNIRTVTGPDGTEWFKGTASAANPKLEEIVCEHLSEYLINQELQVSDT